MPDPSTSRDASDLIALDAALRELADAGDVLPIAASQASDEVVERWVRALRVAHSLTCNSRSERHA